MNNLRDPKLVNDCKEKLLKKKEELLNQIQSISNQLKNNKLSGDAGDMMNSLHIENQARIKSVRIKGQLIEINIALDKIFNNKFGLCEHLDEPIETNRLRAIPWTRYSLEGAEILEGNRKKFSQPRL